VSRGRSATAEIFGAESEARIFPNTDRRRGESRGTCRLLSLNAWSSYTASLPDCATFITPGLPLQSNNLMAETCRHFEMLKIVAGTVAH
jgi:hypothetical protein